MDRQGSIVRHAASAGKTATCFTAWPPEESRPVEAKFRLRHLPKPRDQWGTGCSEDLMETISLNPHKGTPRSRLSSPPGVFPWPQVSMVVVGALLHCRSNHKGPAGSQVAVHWASPVMRGRMKFLAENALLLKTESDIKAQGPLQRPLLPIPVATSTWGCQRLGCQRTIHQRTFVRCIFPPGNLLGTNCGNFRKLIEEFLHISQKSL